MYLFFWAWYWNSKAFERLGCLFSSRLYEYVNHMEGKRNSIIIFLRKGGDRERKQKKRMVSTEGRRIFPLFIILNENATTSHTLVKSLAFGYWEANLHGSFRADTMRVFCFGLSFQEGFYSEQPWKTEIVTKNGEGAEVGWYVTCYIVRIMFLLGQSLGRLFAGCL